MRTLRLASLLALVLALLAPAGHVLEIPGKLRLTAEHWLVVQQTLYPGYAVAGAVTLLGTPLLLAAFAWSVRGTAEARAAWIAAGLVLLGLLAWWLVVAPVNGWIAAATPETLPPAWTAWRTRWEAGHALVALLVATALVLLLRTALSAAQPAPPPHAPPARHRR
ncbi:hypothetical protein DFH01_27125 [Falsiroseomonas bella]|uniref:DUF1772 domain-containing protein n=1 Tax=Falsiroseomonas bella TaxID=2184016 RepID=A0A317F7S0_9PROT|nr:hypothetical protein [Falsiroseomonas bella]PWS34009.1 hypothetical protein DFH01_27125 [Falsiroseomonas bella]